MRPILRICNISLQISLDSVEYTTRVNGNAINELKMDLI